MKNIAAGVTPEVGHGAGCGRAGKKVPEEISLKTERRGKTESYDLSRPNFSINSYRVGRLMPSSIAAAAIFPELFRKAC
jgi:hypothetical protein